MVVAKSCYLLALRDTSLVKSWGVRTSGHPSIAIAASTARSLVVFTGLVIKEFMVISGSFAALRPSAISSTTVVTAGR